MSLQKFFQNKNNCYICKEKNHKARSLIRSPKHFSIKRYLSVPEVSFFVSPHPCK